MSKKFLIIIDTTEGINLRRVARGILNIHVIVAENELDARKKFLSVFNQAVANEITNNLYVYDLDTMSDELSKIDSTKTLPLFSFMPLQGGRPPRQQNPLAVIENNTNTMEPFQQANNTRNSSMLDAIRNNLANQSKEPVLSKEQLDLISRTGAVPTTNPRIATATGVQNINESVVIPKPETTQLNSEQLKLLMQAGVNLTEIKNDVELQEERSTAPVLNEVASVGSERALTEEEIKKLQEEIRG